MRLWHEEIIHLLPKNQLLGQHRECCALRGNGWNKKMEKRGYKVSREWKDKNYRGKTAESYTNLETQTIASPIYKEHNRDYLVECLENLRQKGIVLE